MPGMLPSFQSQSLSRDKIPQPSLSSPRQHAATQRMSHCHMQCHNKLFYILLHNDIELLIITQFGGPVFPGLAILVTYIQLDLKTINVGSQISKLGMSLGCKHRASYLKKSMGKIFCLLHRLKHKPCNVCLNKTS